MDEPAMAMVPLAEECLAWLNKVDPEHPVWAVFANQMSINDFLGGVNIVGTDIYPLHSTDSTVYPIVRGVTDIRQKQLPLWVVVQSYPMSNYMSNSSYYFPTPMEILSQGVAGYIGNAGGLLYYSFMDLRPNNPNAERDILAMSQSINILKSLSVFNSCEYPEQMIVHTEENTAWRLLYDGFEYRLLVLAPNSSGSLTISLPENMEMIHSVTGKTVSENGMLTFCGNKNDCDIISIRTNTAATYDRY
jgi:hypothetical protein